jgi:cytochrome P450
MTKPIKYNYPKSLPLFRFFWNAEAIRKNPLPFHRKFFETYGDTFSVKLGNGKRILLSRDKEVVQYILQKNHKNYYKSSIQTKYLSKYLGNGLLTANGDYWLRQRRLIQPAFHRKKMESLIGLIQKTIEEELNKIPVSTQTDVFKVMNELTFKVVANALFNVSVSEETLKRLQQIIQEIQEFLVKEIRLPHKGWWFHLSGQVKKHKLLAQESRAIIQHIIEERRQSGETHEDLLDMLLATRYEDTGEPMNTEQLIDEISILFVAGHETTANALTFTTFLLAKHPEVCSKVYGEVSAVNPENSTLSEQIKQLEYTRAVIDESMRLYPPAWITDRENLEDDTIKDFQIKKNTLVGVSFYELHRHPDYWQAPETFNPERFLGDAKKQHNDCYYPFGAGPRMCIGMGFAIYEMVLAVAYLVRTYSLKTSATNIKLNPLITLKPIDVKIEFEERI